MLADVARSDKQGAVAWLLRRAEWVSLAARVRGQDEVEGPARCCVTSTQSAARQGVGLQASRTVAGKLG
jgi:hypothetical protein